MKKIRIACCSGGCTYERMEPALEAAIHGQLDYMIFECLAERTIADAQRQKIKDPSSGYNPMLTERMTQILPLMKKYGFKIVSNMGGANPVKAVENILEIARSLNISDLKIAMITGDDITEQMYKYAETPLYQKNQTVSTLHDIVSANVYLGADAITEALSANADIVITGRVADPSLFVGPIIHEFGWLPTESAKIGQAILTGHLMECCTQLTGGYYADPGYKNIPDLHKLGHPIVEISQDGTVVFTKVPGSGGCISTDICKEQLLYEISDPSGYITPDGIADFTNVTFIQTADDMVSATGALSRGLPDSYKVNIGYMAGYMGIGEISYGGTNALRRAELAADTILKRWDIIGIHPLEYRVDYIGHNSLYKSAISEMMNAGTPSEIRLRIAVRTHEKTDAEKLIREVQCMYINGPAGGGGISAHIESILAIENFLIPRQDAKGTVTILEV